MEMSFYFGLVHLVVQWLKAVFSSVPLQRSTISLFHFIYPRPAQGGSNCPSQLPHDVSSKFFLLGFEAKVTMYIQAVAFINSHINGNNL